MATYFATLNYTFINEDPVVEVAMLPQDCRHVMCVAGSGSRSLGLLTKKPQRLTCVDIAQEQLYLTELRVATARTLDYNDFLAFWGYPGKTASPKERKEMFSALHLQKKTRGYLSDLFEEAKWNDLLYLGRWERTIGKVAKVTGTLVGRRGLGIFDVKSLEEQKKYWREIFPHRGLDAAIFLLGNSAFFNSMLYKGHFPQKNIPEGFFEFYKRSLYYLFENSFVRENFFLQLLFLGKVTDLRACPQEAQESEFYQIKENLKDCEISFVRNDMFAALSQSEHKVDYLALSDIVSYFSGDLERNFMQMAREHLNNQAQVIYRSYLHVPTNVDLLGYRETTNTNSGIFEAEKTRVYKIQSFQKIA